MYGVELTDQEFELFSRWIGNVAGISLTSAKKVLVATRLAKRLTVRHCASYGDYFRLLHTPNERAELQMAIDLLTTNETYFFREPKHFDFLRQTIVPGLMPGRTARVWSGASSTGEEIYSIAMVLADVLGERPWEVLGSDISSRVLETAINGLYPLERSKDIPREYLSRFCLKGIGAQEGTFLMDSVLKRRVRFQQVNLIEPLPELGDFDVIFLRNVMIYFNMETKQKVVNNLIPKLRSGGYFILSHSESLNGVNNELKLVRPSIYRKP